jgi:hypothetical protein
MNVTHMSDANANKTNPKPPPTAPPASPKPSRRWVYVWGAASAVAVVLVVLALLKFAVSKPPDPAGDPLTVAKFVATPQFLKLTFDQQRNYMFSLRKEVDALRAARDAGKLDDRQYRYARAAAWTGGKLEHLNDYQKQKTDQAKREYVDKMLGRRKEKKSAATSAPTASEDGSFSDSVEVKQIVKSWSHRREIEWEEFQRVTRERKAALANPPTTAAAATDSK